MDFKWIGFLKKIDIKWIRSEKKWIGFFAHPYLLHPNLSKNKTKPHKVRNHYIII